MFERDAKKALLNLTKHGVSFDEAGTAFLDPNGLDGEDIEHSSSEPRQFRVAESAIARLLVIAYTRRRRGHETVTRIISARPASRREKKKYQERED